MGTTVYCAVVVKNITKYKNCKNNSSFLGVQKRTQHIFWVFAKTKTRTDSSSRLPRSKKFCAFVFTSGSLGWGQKRVWPWK